MKIKLRDRFNTYMGKLCTVTGLTKQEVRLTYLDGEIETYPLEEFKEDVRLNRFLPQPRLTVNRLNIAEHLLEYQLNIIGKTTADATKDDLWFQNYTLTSEQHTAFKAYALPLLKKVFKFNTAKAEETFNWFKLQFGLRIKH